jgi:hypothetical protein
VQDIAQSRADGELPHSASVPIDVQEVWVLVHCEEAWSFHLLSCMQASAEAGSQEGPGLEASTAAYVLGNKESEEEDCAG